MLSPPPADLKQVNSLIHIHSILSYDTNIMLAAIITLLLVILFVLLLHVYSKLFLAQAARQGSRRAVSVPQVLGAHFHHHFRAFGLETTTSATSPAKGLAPSLISSIPSFVYKSDEHKHGLECVICLTVLEDEELGRNLPKCNHAFHVDCIDMWLLSHTTCPICRASVVSETNTAADTNALAVDESLSGGDQQSSEASSDELRRCNDEESVLEIIVEVPSSSSDGDIITTNESSSSSCSCSSLSSEAPSLLGGSLKRMMSRSRCERKVHQSGNASINFESNGSEKE